jgi:hypothetical protein
MTRSNVNQSCRTKCQIPLVPMADRRFNTTTESSVLRIVNHISLIKVTAGMRSGRIQHGELKDSEFTRPSRTQNAQQVVTPKSHHSSVHSSSTYDCVSCMKRYCHGFRSFLLPQTRRSSDTTNYDYAEVDGPHPMPYSKKDAQAAPHSKKEKLEGGQEDKCESTGRNLLKNGNGSIGRSSTGPWTPRFCPRSSRSRC